MASSIPINVSCAEAHDLQRHLEGAILKLEKASLLQEKAGDHIRVIVAEGIADHFGDRYRSYPVVPRPDNLPIRRDLLPTPCVLDTPPTNKPVKKKIVEPVATRTSVSSPGRTTATNTSRGATRRVSAWVAGLANASSASTSPEKSITYETRLAAHASRWDMILDQPIKMSSPAFHSSYTLSGHKTAKRTVTCVPEEDVSASKGFTAFEPTVGTGNDGATETEETDLDAFFNTHAPASSPSSSDYAPPKQSVVRKTAATNVSNDNDDDCSDWLIDLSS